MPRFARVLIYHWWTKELLDEVVIDTDQAFDLIWEDDLARDAVGDWCRDHDELYEDVWWEIADDAH